MTNTDDAKQFPFDPMAPSLPREVPPSSQGPEPSDARSSSLPSDGGRSPADQSSPVLNGAEAEPQGGGRPGQTATYSPEDNKLRLSSATRLDAETYARVKSAGFVWAAKQGFFVAPMWTPERADLLIELCGEIGDEDTSLVERADQRAERFEDYRENRTADAESARRAVAAIADNIPLGQPILVGHHSERHARRDAERIEQGMRKAVRMWETAEYWKQRAAGALRHARYKERPDVRFRRMKGIKSELRKHEKHIKASEAAVKLWQRPDLTVEQATGLANYDHVYLPSDGHRFGSSLWSLLRDGTITAEAAAEKAIAIHMRGIAHARRWIAHLNNRLTYEREMLGEAGGLPADRFSIEVGGRVLVKTWRSQEWATVLRIHRTRSRINSVRTNSDRRSLVPIEEICDYKPPQGDDAEKVRAATKLPPLCNYPGTGFLQMTRQEWDRKHRDFKITKTAEANAQHRAYRYRQAFMPGGSFQTAQVFITDAKRVDPPTPTTGRKRSPASRADDSSAADSSIGPVCPSRNPGGGLPV